MSNPYASRIVAIAGLIILCFTAYYFVMLFRDMATGGRPSEPTDYISDFRRLRDEGKLDDEEFKRLTGSATEEPDFKESTDQSNTET